MTQYPEIFAALAAPFGEGEVKVRQQAGRQLHYITARTVANRLDDILGPENWWDSYQPFEHSVLCTLTIRLPDGTLLSKQDAGGYAGMSDQGDDDKSGYSDAFKRAAVKFGVARYLYRDGVPEFVRGIVGGFDAPRSQPQQQYRQEPPRQDRDDRGHQDRRPQDNGGGGGNGGGFNSPPRSGRALFAWVKDQEQRHEVGLLQYLNKWGKLQDFPGRMVDWDADQVAAAHAEALKKVERAGRNEALEEALEN